MNSITTDIEFLKNIKIDTEFQETCPELSDKEFETLEENILSEGEVTAPIYIWNDTMIDGHHRRQIILKHPHIPFQIKKINFNNRYEAIAWICKNQIGRRNLNHVQLDYLIGKRYEAEKQAYGDWSRTSENEGSPSYQNDNLEKKENTSERISHEYGIGSATVIRNGQYAKGVDTADNACPGAKKELLSGELKATKADVIALGKMSPKQVPEAVSNLRKLQAEREEKQRQAREDRRNKVDKAEPTEKTFTSISELSASMAEPKHRNTVSNVLGIICEAAKNMQATCEAYIADFPELLEKDKPQLLQALNDLKDYINNLYEEK